MSLEDAQGHTGEGHGRLDALVLVDGKGGAKVVSDTNAGLHAGRRVHALVTYAGEVFREHGKVVSLLAEIEAPRVDECLIDLRAGGDEVRVIDMDVGKRGTHHRHRGCAI